MSCMAKVSQINLGYTPTRPILLKEEDADNLTGPA